jgi:rare lipoprotein A
LRGLIPIVAVAAFAGGCGAVGSGGMPAPAVFEEGVASWYGPGFAGRPTASGEVFDPDALTAAHRRLPFGTRVRVVNLDNGRQIVVRINDRGPSRSNRIIDVSAAAAEALGMVQAGTARVQLVIER